jgi:excisionase family DNA binding protein
MNRRDMLDLGELLERINQLINEYMRASTPERLAFLEAEITAAKEKLQRIAAKFINRHLGQSTWIDPKLERCPIKSMHFDAETHLVTVGEVADYLHVSHSTIFRLLKRKELPGFKVGGDWRFTMEEIDRWCAERQNRTPTY